MAGRPAVGRGGNGMLYGLVTFAVLAVAGLGAFIWQLTDNKRLKDASDSAARRLKQYGTPPAYYADEATARSAPVFETMQKDFEELALLVTGKKEAVWPAIRDQADQVRRDIAATAPDVVNASDTLMTVVLRLFRAHTEQQTSITQMQGQIAALQSENAKLANGVKEARDRFEQQVGELRTQVDQLTQQTTTQLSEKDQQLTERQAQSDALNEELSRQKQQTQRTARDTEILVGKLNQRIGELESKLRIFNVSGFNAEDILTKSDGQVLRAIPGSEIVYVNLGEADRVKPGMKFTVFSPDAIGSGGFGGKATIEIASVFDSTSECKILSGRPGRPIVEGDIIVNLAYERNRKPQFVVIGQFDLDHDSLPDIDGVEKVAGMIGDWGGVVAREVSEATDFVVVGLGPQETAGGSTTEVVAALQAGRSEEREAWLATVQKAHDFYIPVLTQSQFLYLTGYSGVSGVARR